MEDKARTCPACQATLDPGAPEGLCPRCLLERGLEEKTLTASREFAPPGVAQLNDALPEYETLELLGRGGMGAVYKARHRKLDRLVALKVLPPEIGADPAFQERFVREARALARLSHPNLVMVHDFGDAGGFYYFAMEYVEGWNLRAAMQGRMTAPEACDLIGKVCDALAYAHSQGVVHRDIKPENILIEASGRVRLADFGLAKLVAAPRDVTLTATHQVMGTPHYMAPEQIEQPDEVDHRADLYAVGVVLYELLTEQLPLGRFPSPSEKGAPKSLDDIVMRTLERDPDARPSGAAELAKAIAAAKPGEIRPARSRTPEPRPAVERSAKSRRDVYVRVAVAGGVVFVASFLPWIGYSVRGGTATVNAWKSHVALGSLHFPNLLVAFTGIALTAIAVGSLAGWWQASARIVGGTAAYGLAHTATFTIFGLYGSMSPQLGAWAAFACFVFVLVNAFGLRTPSARQPATTKRPRRKRRRKARTHAKKDPDKSGPSAGGKR